MPVPEHRPRNNFNPRSPWGGGATSDTNMSDTESSNFNPRSPQGERHIGVAADVYEQLFQSTLPAGGATYHTWHFRCGYQISIHAPRRGSDTRCFSASSLYPRDFNPRSPQGERLSVLAGNPCFISISIHAPRRGSDHKADGTGTDQSYFNPRSPQGERRLLYVMPDEDLAFQSTLPAGGATRSAGWWLPFFTISIHAPRRWSDLSFATVSIIFRISIHAPRRGSD